MQLRWEFKAFETSGPGSLIRAGATILTLALLSAAAGCTAGGGLPPVFGAVFGISGVEVAPFTVGTIEDPVVRPEDRLIGTAANDPGQCIYFRGATDRRFRADCPEGYEL